MPLSVPMVFDELNYRKESKNTHKPRYCEKQMYKANKRILRSLSFDNNGLMWPYGLIFKSYKSNGKSSHDSSD
jgi:hypothetical protein